MTDCTQCGETEAVLEVLTNALRSIEVGCSSERPETLEQAQSTIATTLRLARKALDVYQFGL